MTKDNASGAGMEPQAWGVYAEVDGVMTIQYPVAFSQEDAEIHALMYSGCETEVSELVRRTDATRLLAESQAHNAKLEAQVERLRMLIVDDAYAMSFQTFGQYRTALLAALKP
jgi:hypothetical protein